MNYTKNVLLLVLAASVKLTGAFVAPSKAISAFGVKQTVNVRFSEVGEVQDIAAPDVVVTAAAVVEPERFALYVRNLPYTITEDDLSNAFSAFGSVGQIALPRNKASGDAKGFAFIDMGSKEQVDKAIASMDGQVFNGRSISVSPMLPKEKVPERQDVERPVQEKNENKAYIGNLPFGVTEDAVKEFFAEQSSVTEVYLAKESDTGKDRGFGFVSFANEADMIKAIESLDGKFFQGRRLAVRKPLKKGEKSEVKPKREGMTRVYIGNLSFETKLETLKDLLSQHGEVMDVFINEDQTNGLSKGFAFAQMAPEDAEKAIAALDDTEVDGRLIRVSKAEKKTAKTKLYIGNLSFDTEKSTVQNMLEEFGTVDELYMPRSTEGGYRGFAIVTMDPDSAMNTIAELDGVEVDGRYITIKEAQPKGAPKAPRSQNTKLYIGNLSFYTPAETVKAAFAEFGEVIDCFLPTDAETGGSRGFGFVTMKAEDAAVAQSEMDGIELDGRFVQVNEAQPKGQSGGSAAYDGNQDE